MDSYIECPKCHKVSTVYPSKLEGHYVCIVCCCLFIPKKKKGEDNNGKSNIQA